MGDRAASAEAEPRIPLYLRLARLIEEQIRTGALRVGDKVPSVRKLRRQQRVSASTVLQAYFWLENRGCIEPRARSGFYVKVPQSGRAPEPRIGPSRPGAKAVGVGEILREAVRAAADPLKVPFGAACPSPDLLPNRRLNHILRSIARWTPHHSARYELPPGAAPLRHQIARRALELGCTLDPDEIIITCGAMQALNLSLLAVGKPGDVVALESPTYFGILQAVEALGMRVVEIPTHPRTGISLDLLERAIKKHRISACIAMTNCHNPLGYVLSEERTKALVDLTARHEVPLIEDDIYGDLAYDQARPQTAKALDRKGLVLLCSSFSKILAPGFRIGWVHAGRFSQQVERLMFLTTIAAPSLPQLAVAEFLESGGYDRHLRRLRATFANQVDATAQAIAKHFPEKTRISRPDGGFLLWVELPKQIDAIELCRRALTANIGILPGPIFSASGQFRHHIRMSCGHPMSETTDRAIRTLGRICATMLGRAPAHR
ncbi:MAG TPA: PLP-dependent aminotransferase family protein [Candidatus Polarisedimenticolia bacterium]|nr:PLP-dependent aminotransferase family protein [Candidatus Polarisedimenticolia bacterium]